jgi:hypothetical protein
MVRAMRAEKIQIKDLLSRFKEKGYYDPRNIGEKSICFDFISLALLGLMQMHSGDCNSAEYAALLILNGKVEKGKNVTLDGSVIRQFDSFLMKQCNEDELNIFSKIIEVAAVKHSDSDCDNEDDESENVYASPTPRNEEMEYQFKNASPNFSSASPSPLVQQSVFMRRSAVESTQQAADVIDQFDDALLSTSASASVSRVSSPFLEMSEAQLSPEQKSTLLLDDNQMSFIDQQMTQNNATDSTSLMMQNAREKTFSCC